MTGAAPHRNAVVGKLFSWRSYLPLLLLSVLLLRCWSPAAALPFKQANLVVPVVLPNSRIPLASVRAVLSLCLSDIAASGLLPNNTLQLVYSDSGNTPQGSVAALLDVYTNTSLSASNNSLLVAVLGEYTSDNTIALALAASGIGVPTLVPVSSSATLSDKTTYPYAIRTSTAVSNLGYAVLAILNNYGWSKFAVIFTDDDDGRGLISNIITNVPATTQMSVYSLPPLSNSSITQTVADRFIDKTLTAIQQAGTRIVILHGAQSPQMLSAAKARGMLLPPYVWIGTNWCNASTVASLNKRWGGDSSALTGTMCVSGPTSVTLAARQDSVGQAWADFTTRLSTTAPTLFPVASNIDIGFGYVYDCLYLLATAISNVSASLNGTRPTTATLWTALNSQDYYGVTGHLHWPTNGSLTGDRYDSLPVLNYDPQSASYKAVGQYSVLRSVLNLTQTVLWNDGTTSASSIPKDRPRVYLPGDVLATLYDSRVLVLAYVMAVFGAWTALILLEQAISTRLQRQKEARSEQARQRQTGGSASTAVWVGWTAGASVALGGCTVWSMNLICVGSLTLDTLTFTVLPGPVIGCLPLSILLCFVGLMFAVTAQQPLAASNQDSSASNSMENTEKSSTGTHSTTTRASNTKHSVTSTTANGLRESRRQRKGRERRESIRQAAGQLLGWRLILCSLLLALAMVTCHSLLVHGMHGLFTENVDVSQLVTCGVLVWLVGHFPLWMMFHWHQSAFRFLAAFCLAAVMLGSYDLAKDAHVYRYQSYDTSAPASDSFDPSVLTSLVAVAAAVSITCLALIIFNVSVLKRGRVLLDHVLDAVHAQQEKLEKDAEDVSKTESRLRDDLAEIRRTLELVAYCRPIFRPYAVAIALANVDPAALEASQGGGKGGQPHSEQSAVLSSNRSQQTSSKSNPGDQTPSTAASSSKADDTDESSQQRNQQKQNQQQAGSLRVPVGGASPTLSPALGSNIRSTSTAGSGPLLTPSARTQSNGGNRLLSDRSSSASQGSSPSLAPATSSVTTSDSPDARLAAAGGSPHKNDFDLVLVAKSAQSVLALLTEMSGFFDGAVSSAAASHLSFDTVMHSLLGFELMKDAVARQFTPENLAMWVDIQRYNQLREFSVRKRVAKQMHAYYMADGAPYEINVSAVTKQTINSELERLEQLDGQEGPAGSEAGCWLWSEVESELVRLIFSNQWEQFTSSPAYKLVLLTVCCQHMQQKQRVKSNAATAGSGSASWSNVNVSEVVRALQQEEAATLIGSQSGYDTSLGRITPTGSPAPRLPSAGAAIRARSSTVGKQTGSVVLGPRSFRPSPVASPDLSKARTSSGLLLYKPLRGALEASDADASARSEAVESEEDGHSMLLPAPSDLELDRGSSGSQLALIPLQHSESVDTSSKPTTSEDAATDDNQWHENLTTAEGTASSSSGALAGESDLATADERASGEAAASTQDGAISGALTVDAEEQNVAGESAQPSEATAQAEESGDVDWEDFGIGNR